MAKNKKKGKKSPQNYEVGYCKPPEQYKWKKGCPSPNPKGRPKKIRTLKEALQVSFNKEVNGRDENGEVYFGIGVGNAHYGKNGIMFSSCDHEGKAFMTTANPVTNDHSNRMAEQEILIKKFAGLINNLNKIEDQVIAAFNEITDIEAETASSIVFVDDTANVSIDNAIFEDICAPSNPPTTEGEM